MHGHSHRYAKKVCIQVFGILCTYYHIQFHDDNFQLRSRLTRAYHCSDLDGPLHDHFATTYGISCDSILNKSFFHVVDGMIPDVMHDIL